MLIRYSFVCDVWGYYYGENCDDNEGDPPLAEIMQASVEPPSKMVRVCGQCKFHQEDDEKPCFCGEGAWKEEHPVEAYDGLVAYLASNPPPSLPDPNKAVEDILVARSKFQKPTEAS